MVGVVTGRSGEGWRVDIGGAHAATLDGYAFEGASKRNKPNLKVNCLAIMSKSRLMSLSYFFASGTGQFSCLCTRFIGTQGHGPGNRMLRRADAEGRRVW